MNTTKIPVVDKALSSTFFQTVCGRIPEGNRGRTHSLTEGFMKHTTIGLMVLVSLVIGSAPTRADSGNPFGFETNKHPLKYDYCKKTPKFLRNHGYSCSTAPRPHPDLESYSLQFVEGVGLCRIQSLSTNFVSDMDFTHAIEVLKSQIARKYGPPTKETKEDGESYQERHLQWLPEAGFKGVGEVKAIDLKASALMEGMRSTLTVSFKLATSDACQEEIDRKAARAF